MRAGECIHLQILPGTGGRLECKLGHDPEKNAGPLLGRAFRVPCRTLVFWDNMGGRIGAKAHGEARRTCADFCEPTGEQIAVHEAEVKAAVERMLANERAGKCNTCGEPVEPRRQVGRCIYAACGHRIGQGKL